MLHLVYNRLVLLHYVFYYTIHPPPPPETATSRSYIVLEHTYVESLDKKTKVPFSESMLKFFQFQQYFIQYETFILHLVLDKKNIYIFNAS